MNEWTEPEYATVGSLLLAPAELRQVRGWLRPEDFATPLAGEVYGLVLTMTANGTPVDPITVREELRKAGRLRRDGWPAMELIRMVEAVPSPLSVGYYGRLVLEGALYRRVEQTGKRLVQAGRNRRGEVDDVFGLIRDECQQLVDLRRRYVDATSTPPGRGGPTPVGSLVRDTVTEHSQARGRVARG
jgi:replicative DNA helicase